MNKQVFRTATHWGTYDAKVENGRITALRPFGGDPDPSPIGQSMPAAVHSGNRSGDVVRVFNGRGACLAGAAVTAGVAPRVVQMATGAWYDPAEPGGLDRHGNPNVLTLDKGTSRLGQGPSAHTTLVEVEKFDGEAPAVEAFEPPVAVAR